MDFSSAKSLARELVNLRLISKDQANFCLRQLDHEHRSGSDMLQALQDHNLLTPFQIENIRKLDTSLLVLGGNKLLYPNAAGSFARVFRGENLDTGQTVAVKVLRNRWNNDPDTIDLFRREAELGQKLKHKNIAAIYDIGFESDQHFFTMEFIEGGNLKDFVQIRKQIEPLETLKYATDMARGLEYAIQQGVTHRDLKTTNVLFSMDGSAKLIDFGLATDEELLKQTGDGAVQNALEYSTLEKATGAPRNDHRSDLFFLGAILYEMLLGQPPYPRTRSREERKQITRYRNIRPLSQVMPNCPRHVTDIVERLLQINPEERYQTATELLVDLNEARIRLQQEQRKNESANPRQPSEKRDREPPTLLCVESRSREQDILREYFTRHGFRVLVMSDASRAARRVNSDPPRLLLYLMGQNSPGSDSTELKELLTALNAANIPSVIALKDQECESLSEFNQGTVTLLKHPQALRNLRTTLVKLAKSAGQELNLATSAE